MGRATVCQTGNVQEHHPKRDRLVPFGKHVRRQRNTERQEHHGLRHGQPMEEADQQPCEQHPQDEQQEYRDERRHEEREPRHQEVEHHEDP